MRVWHKNRKDAMSKYKNAIEVMLKYLKREGVFDIKQLNKERDRLGRKIDRLDRYHVLNKFEPYYNFIQYKIEKLETKECAVRTALELCHLLELEDTSSFSKEMLDDRYISHIIDLACKDEIDRNKYVDKTGEGYHSYEFCKIIEQENIK